MLQYVWRWVAAILNLVAYFWLGLIIKRLDNNGFRWNVTSERCMHCDAPLREERIKAIQMFL